MLSFPLIARAQGSTPPATPPSMPSTSAMTEQMHKATGMSDSAKAAWKSDVQHQLKQMGEQLKLTPQQQASVKPILTEHATQVKQLRDKYAPMARTAANKEAMTKEMQSLRDATDAKLAGVLSADQMTQYKKMRDEQMAKMKSKMATGEAKPEEKK
jgi:hypothetical protein